MKSLKKMSCWLTHKPESCNTHTHTHTHTSARRVSTALVALLTLVSFSIAQGQSEKGETRTCERVGDKTRGQGVITVTKVLAPTGYWDMPRGSESYGYQDALSFYSDVEYYGYGADLRDEKALKNQTLRAIAQAEIAINFAKAVAQESTPEQEHFFKELSKLVNPHDLTAQDWSDCDRSFRWNRNNRNKGTDFIESVKVADRSGMGRLIALYIAHVESVSSRSFKLDQEVSLESGSRVVRPGEGINLASTLNRSIDDLKVTAKAVLAAKQRAGADKIGAAATTLTYVFNGASRASYARDAILEVFEGNYIQNEIARLTTEFYEMVNVKRAERLRK